MPYLTNNVTLDPTIKDINGQPAPRITYQIGKFEKISQDFFIPLLMAMCGASGAQLFAAVPQALATSLGGVAPPTGEHTMGGMQMGPDPTTSVVDANGKVTSWTTGRRRQQRVRHLQRLQSHPDDHGGGAVDRARAHRPAALTLMTFLITTPDIIGRAATDLADIGSTLGLANFSAAPPTTGILAAAQDEVSIQIAATFSRYAEDFQRVSRGASAYHASFVQALHSAAGAYAAADISLAGVFNAVVYQPTYTAGQAWITSRVGEFVDDTFINPIGQALIGRDLLGNGAAGIEWRNGPAGRRRACRLLFGNGGPARTAASGQGGLGGAAGLIGNGGSGGLGADGAPGGDGGSGVMADS